MTTRHARAVLDHYDGPPHLRMTLVSLAVRANEEGKCWPSYERIARDCGVSRRRAIQNVDALLSDRLLIVAEPGGPRVRDGRPRRANVYLLGIERLEALSGWQGEEAWRLRCAAGVAGVTSEAGDTRLVMPASPADSDAPDTPRSNGEEALNWGVGSVTSEAGRAVQPPQDGLLGAVLKRIRSLCRESELTNLFSRAGRLDTEGLDQFALLLAEAGSTDDVRAALDLVEGVEVREAE